MNPVLLDTGAIVAALDRSEHHHEACRAVLESMRRPLVTCEAVIAEACYLLRNLPGAPEAVLENIEQGVFQIPLQIAPSAAAIRRIMRKYANRKIDLADACLIHMANELKTGDILTLDHDFEFYRWGAKRSFELLIPLRR